MQSLRLLQCVNSIVYRCSSNGGCHCVIISDDERADPTNPTGGPDGAVQIINEQV